MTTDFLAYLIKKYKKKLECMLDILKTRYSTLIYVFFKCFISKLSV